MFAFKCEKKKKKKKVTSDEQRVGKIPSVDRDKKEKRKRRAKKFAVRRSYDLDDRRQNALLSTIHHYVECHYII